MQTLSGIHMKSSTKENWFNDKKIGSLKEGDVVSMSYSPYNFEIGINGEVINKVEHNLKLNTAFVEFEAVKKYDSIHYMGYNSTYDDDEN